jgi:hypothetical protein
VGVANSTARGRGSCDTVRWLGIPTRVVTYYVSMLRQDGEVAARRLASVNLQGSGFLPHAHLACHMHLFSSFFISPHCLVLAFVRSNNTHPLRTRELQLVQCDLGPILI